VNKDTGVIRSLENDEKPTLEEVLIYETNLTRKQKELRQVSLHDHRSVAGKLLTQYRHIPKSQRKGKTAEQIRAMRAAEEESNE
jgi:hypothetical protein